MCKLQKLLGTLFTKCCLSPTFYRRTVSGQQHSLRRIWLIASQPGGCQPADALGSVPVSWVAIELASSTEQFPITCNSPTYQVSLSRAKAGDAAPRNIESIQELPWSKQLFHLFNFNLLAKLIFSPETSLNLTILQWVTSSGKVLVSIEGAFMNWKWQRKSTGH